MVEQKIISTPKKKEKKKNLQKFKTNINEKKKNQPNHKQHNN